MNRKDVIDAVAARAQTTRDEAERFVQHAFDALSEALKRGESVTIVRFGRFEVRDHKPKRVKNLVQLDDTHEAEPRRRVKFTAADHLNEVLNDNGNRTHD